MRHTEKYFWLYVGSYLVLVSSIFLIAEAILEYAFLGAMPQLVSPVVGLLLCAFCFTIVKQRRHSEQVHDNTGDG